MLNMMQLLDDGIGFIFPAAVINANAAAADGAAAADVATAADGDYCTSPSH